jgi:hypothetical protein
MCCVRVIPRSSQPPAYGRPHTKSGDIAQNYYYGRDARRNYPRTSFYTQKDIAGLIAATNLRAVAGDVSDSTEVAKLPENLTVTDVIAKVSPLYSTNRLPPIPPGKPQHNWKPSEEAFKPDDGKQRIEDFVIAIVQH